MSEPKGTQRGGINVSAILELKRALDKLSSKAAKMDMTVEALLIGAAKEGVAERIENNRDAT